MKILKLYMKAVETVLSVAAFAALTGCSGASGSNSDSNGDNSLSTAGQLRSFLIETSKKGAMLGHQDDLAYGSTWHGDSEGSDMRDVCGDYPAVFGWDISGIESGNKLNPDSVAYAKIAEYIKKADGMNGISAIRWDGCSFINADNTEKDASLDKIAAFLQSLKSSDGNTIPVVLQPLSNKNADTVADRYKESWIYIHKYLSKKGVNNVLYAFSVSKADDLSAYPGDGYVDIVGLDSLFAGKLNYASEIGKSVNLVADFAKKHGKIAVISAIGLKGIKEPGFFTTGLLPAIRQKGLSYVILWKNSWKDEDYCHVPVKGHPAADDFIKFIETDDILTLKDIAK